MLTLALSKGRILKDTLPLLSKLGIEPLEEPGSSRKLILPTNRDDLRLLIVRATDAPTYVQYGAADIGVAGKDVLLEHGGDGLYEPLDLQIAKCRIAVCGHEGVDLQRPRLRVATKYTNIAKRYFSAQGQHVDMVKLYGSMELAPLIGLSDVIVDLVDTGNTLRANGLVPLVDIADISTRLIVNRASLKTQHPQITQLIHELREVVGESAAAA